MGPGKESTFDITPSIESAFNGKRAESGAAQKVHCQVDRLRPTRHIVSARSLGIASF